MILLITLMFLGVTAGEQGWYEVPDLRNFYIHRYEISYDLETYPLEVKTENGSRLEVGFANADGRLSGVSITSTSPPQYFLDFCTQWTNFETSLPSADEKIWRIMFSRTSGSRLIVQCNGKEVLNFLMSDSTCSSYSDWRDQWTGYKVAGISFYNSGTLFRPVLTQSDGWYAVGDNTKLPYDLETYPLEVKTNSVIGSWESWDQLYVRLYNSADEWSGPGVGIRFTYRFYQYILDYCSGNFWVNFETSLPSDDEKIWRIIFSRTSGSRLIVQCNGKEVLNILMSNSTCSDSRWRKHWTSKIEDIEFSFRDTASDGFRSSDAMADCTGLKTEWEGAIHTTTQFPVQPGTVVELTCSRPEASFSGNRTVTCIRETEFSYSEEPTCFGWYAVSRGSWTDYDLETYPLEVKTDSAIGSEDKVRVWFKNSAGEHSGVFISFTSPPRYQLINCINSWTNLETSLPSADKKTWRIIFSRTSGSRLILQCNDKEVLNILMSDSTCSYNGWRKRWTNKVEQIFFSLADTASDSFRLPDGQ